MTKRIITSLMFIAAISISARSNPNLKCETLLTLGKNEIIEYDEYTSTLTSTNDFRYACVIVDTVTNSATFVWNGEYKVKSDNRFFFTIHDSQIDLYDFSKLTYQYNIGKDCYLVIEGTKYGPYEDVWYIKPNILGTSYIYPNLFKFSQMGTKFTHYQDGTIRPITSPPSKYTSNNGKHSVEFTYNYLILDGKKIEFPKTDKIIEYFNDVCILDNGTCTFEIVTSEFYEDGWGIKYVATSEGIKELDLTNEYFNYETGQVEEYALYDEDIDSPDELGYSLTLTLQDDAKKHYFLSNWNYNYVIVDGVKLGKSTPINAIYEKKLNAFRWSALEDQKLVLYTYYLD